MPSRRTVLAAASAGLGLAVAGCTSRNAAVQSDLAEARGDRDGWPSVGYDPTNGGYNDSGAVIDDPAVVWETAESVALTGFSVTDEFLLAPGDPLKAFDLESGEVRWRHPETDPWVQPTVLEDTVFAADSADGSLLGLSAAEGSRRWESDLPEAVRVRTPPALAGRGDRLFVGCTTGGDEPSEQLYALEVDTGDVVWSRELFGAPSTALAINMDQIVATTSPGLVYSFTDTGTAYWKRNLRERIECAPVLGDDRVYVGGHGGTVYALDRTSGATEWTRDVSGFVRDAMAFDGRRLYVQSGRTVAALEADSGDVDWEYETAESARYTPVVADGVVYAGTGAGDVVALETDGGGLLGDHERWSLAVGDSVGRWAALTEDRLYASVLRERDRVTQPIVAVENA